jgi:inosose dehydratase
VRIATAVVNWNNPDIPEIFPWIPYAEAMDHFVEAGYDATEWGPSMPTDPELLGLELRSRGLDLVGAFVGLGFRDAAKWEAELDRALDIAHFLAVNGGTQVIAAEAGDDRRRGEAGHVDEAHGLTDGQWRNLAQGLEALGRRLQPMGMELVFHNHVGTYVETPAETARLLDETDPALVGWCLDIGHLAYGGGAAIDLLPRYAGRVRHVHIKDVDGEVLARAKAGGWSFGQALAGFIFPPLGQGIARIPDVVEALGRVGYDGWYVIEQDTARGDPTETARANREYLERLLAVVAAGG